MQSLWARVLAGEANNPGSYSKRTVNFISSIDKSDAVLFTTLCSYCWVIDTLSPLILNLHHEIYMRNGIDFAAMRHLEDIGLVKFDSTHEYVKSGFPRVVRLFYYGKPVEIRFERDDGNSLKLGHVLLSRVGQELAPISGSEPLPDFFDYAVGKWREMGFEVVT
jgi:hypothetical protein